MLLEEKSFVFVSPPSPPALSRKRERERRCRALALKFMQQRRSSLKMTNRIKAVIGIISYSRLYPNRAALPSPSQPCP